jgi:hypothetical protein
MTKTNKAVRQVPAVKALDRPVNRGSQSKPTGLYLLALRSHHAAAQSPVPRRKLAVTVETSKSSDGLAKPIKIIVS